MTTNEFLTNSYKRNYPTLVRMSKTFERDMDKMYFTRPRVVCKDGFSISIQASYVNYCIPRLTFSGDYEAVELGYPSKKEPLIADYAEDPDNLTSTVYGTVPVKLVDKVLKKHGGIIDEQELKMV